MSTNLEDIRKRFAELDNLITHISEVYESVYKAGYLREREDLLRELHLLKIEGDTRQKEFDDFERAGFSPEECEALRDIQDKYNISSEPLINIARELNGDSMKLARFDALLSYMPKR